MGSEVLDTRTIQSWNPHRKSFRIVSPSNSKRYVATKASLKSPSPNRAAHRVVSVFCSSEQVTHRRPKVLELSLSAEQASFWCRCLATCHGSIVQAQISAQRWQSGDPRWMHEGRCFRTPLSQGQWELEVQGWFAHVLLARGEVQGVECSYFFRFYDLWVASFCIFLSPKKGLPMPHSIDGPLLKDSTDLEHCRCCDTT